MSLKTVFSKVTSVNFTAAISSRFFFVSSKTLAAVSCISRGVSNQTMGGTVVSVLAFSARALSTSLGEQVPQTDLKSNSGEFSIVSVAAPFSSRMVLEKALKQQGQRGFDDDIVVFKQWDRERKNCLQKVVIVI